MPKEIANAFVYVLVLLAIILVPATGLYVFDLPQMQMISGIIFMILLGIGTGVLKQKYLEDNLTTFVASLFILLVTTPFLASVFWQNAIFFAGGYFLGRKLSESDMGL